MRKKSAKQRKHLLLDILATINELSNTKKSGIFELSSPCQKHSEPTVCSGLKIDPRKTLLIQYLAENFDKRLLYFTSVYLTSKKYIDFITLLPEPLVIKIISNIDPGIGLIFLNTLPVKRRQLPVFESEIKIH